MLSKVRGKNGSFYLARDMKIKFFIISLQNVNTIKQKELISFFISKKKDLLGFNYLHNYTILRKRKE